MLKNKKIVITSIFLLFVMSISFANPPGRRGRGLTKEKAKRVLLRTNKVLFHTRNQIKKNKVFTGHFKKAVLHQRMARRKFRAGQLRKAVAHSRYARRLSTIALQKNKGKKIPECSVSKEETSSIGELPSDQTLDQDLKTEMPSDIKEEDLIDEEDLSISID